MFSANASNNNTISLRQMALIRAEKCTSIIQKKSSDSLHLKAWILEATWNKSTGYPSKFWVNISFHFFSSTLLETFDYLVCWKLDILSCYTLCMTIISQDVVFAWKHSCHHHHFRMGFFICKVKVIMWWLCIWDRRKLQTCIKEQAKKKLFNRRGVIFRLITHEKDDCLD